jgi:hypothetical protein
MPDAALVLNPGSGGDSLDTHQDPTSSRKTQKVAINNGRGGILYKSSSGLITATAVASQQLWHLLNPNASGKTIYIQEISVIGFNSAAAALIPIRLVRTSGTVPTGGSTLTPARVDGNATIGNVGVPRFGGSGFLMTGITASGGAIGSAMLPLTAGATYPALLYTDGQTFHRDLVVAANSGLLIDAIGTPNAAHRLTVDVVWEEV